MRKMKNETLTKGLELLFLLSRYQTPLMVSEMAQILKVPASTLYRIVRTLNNYGLVERIDSAGHYKLGYRNLVLARGVEEQDLLIKFALPEMKTLADIAEETVLLTTVMHNKSICIERVESNTPIKLTSEKGRIMPLYAGASGKILLAFLPAKERHRLIYLTPLKPLTPKTITEPKKLEENLENIRKNGYAYSNSEMNVGVVAVAAPIFDDRKKIIGGLTIAGPEQRMGEKRLPLLITMVKNSADRISSLIISNLKV